MDMKVRETGVVISAPMFNTVEVLLRGTAPLVVARFSKKAELMAKMAEGSTAKNDAQGFGSALSYARRYSLMAACGIAPEDDDGNAASVPPKAVPKPAPPPAPKPPVAVPKKIEGKDKEWQLKVSAEPDTDFEDWFAVVVELTVTALDAASNKDDVMNIWRTNANIYKSIEQHDPESYKSLLDTFGTYKEAFNDN